MMVTEHALKRLALLTMDVHAQREVLFLHRFLLPGVKTIYWDHGIHIDDIPLFAKRCHYFDGRMLGLETSWLDSPYPLYTFAFEDYSEQYSMYWYQQAILEFKQAKVFNMIIPTISIPENVLAEYMG